MHATQTPETFIALVCSECGVGNYRRSVVSGNVACDYCDHAIYSGDIELDEGETFAWSGPNGVYGYVSADDDSPHVGHYSTFGTWWCDTCNSPYCDLA